MRSKKLLICLVFLFVSLFAFGFNAKVNAIETSDAITVIGAQVRSTGNAGIRFVANETYEGEDSYGILLAFGETEANEEFVVGGTVNGKTVANAEVATAEDGVFKVTLYNIPEVYYTQAISARAYVKVGENYVYSSTVCVKSLAEVALKGKANGEEGTLIDDVNEYVFANYKYYGTLNEKVALFDLPLVSSLEVANLEAEFIADANEFLGLSLTVDTTYKNFVAALAPDKSIKTDVTAVNAYKFFNDVEMGTKWRWVAEYLEVNGSSHVKNQAIEILDDGIYDSKVVDGYTLSNLYGLEHFASALYILLNAEAQAYTPNQYSLSMDFTDPNKYEVVNQYYLDSVAAKLEGLVRVGDKVTLPAALEKVGYTWAGWFDGINTLAAGSEYTVTNDDLKLSASFTTIEYTIKYFNGDVEYTDLASTYTVEDAVSLAELENQSGFLFAGWYEDAEFSGDAVTQIPEGTTGNKVYYAKIVEGYDVVAVDASWSTLEAGASVELNESQYTFGANAHATITEALQFVKENGTIYVAEGTYAESVTFSKSGISLIGPNANVPADGTTDRAEEAVIDGITYIQANDFVVNGFYFTKAISVGANNATISYSYILPTATVACDGTSGRKGCIAGSTSVDCLTVDNCYIDAPGTSNSYLYQFISFNTLGNLTFTNNLVTNSKQTTASGSYGASMVYNASGVYNINNNIFNWGTTGYLLRIGYTTNTITEFNFKDNVLDGNGSITTNAGIQLKLIAAGSTYNIIGNEWNNVCGSMFILTSAKAGNVNIAYNNFNTGTSYKMGTVASAVVTYTNNYYALSSQTTTTSDFGTYTHDAAGLANYKADYAAYKAQ